MNVTYPASGAQRCGHVLPSARTASDHLSTSECRNGRGHGYALTLSVRHKRVFVDSRILPLRNTRQIEDSLP